MSGAALFKGNPKKLRRSSSSKGKKKVKHKKKHKRNPGLLGGMGKGIGKVAGHIASLTGGALVARVVEQNLPASFQLGPLAPVLGFVVAGGSGYLVKRFAPKSIKPFGDSIILGGGTMAGYRIVAPYVLPRLMFSQRAAAPSGPSGVGETLVRINEDASSFPGSTGQGARVGGFGETFVRGGQLAGGSESAGPPWGGGNPWNSRR